MEQQAPLGVDLREYAPAAAEEKNRERLRIPPSERQIRLGKEFVEWIANSNATPIVVSPHPDDAELSIAGLMKTVNSNSPGAMRHIVVFSRGSEEEAGLYEERKQEVYAADSQLGVDEGNIAFLDQLDLPYRRSQATSAFAKLQQHNPRARSLPVVVEADKQLVDRLSAGFQTVITQHPNPLFFVPIGGIGRHTDHHLVRVATERAIKAQNKKSAHVVLYDEHPYNQHHRPLALQLRGTAKPAQFVENQGLRRRAISMFGTQLPGVYQPHGRIPLSLPPERVFIPKSTVRDMRSA